MPSPAGRLKGRGALRFAAATDWESRGNLLQTIKAEGAKRGSVPFEEFL